MAKDKKSFILYADQIHIFEELTDQEAGQAIKHLYQFCNDLNPPDPENRLVKIAIEPIKRQLKRDLQNWLSERSKRSEAGKRGGIKSGVSRRSEANRRSASKNEANEADNVIVTVNVNENVNVKYNEGAKLKKDQGWKEQFCMSKNLTLPELDELLDDFLDRIKLTEDPKPVSELKKHFLNWFLKRPEKKQIIKSKLADNRW